MFGSAKMRTAVISVTLLGLGLLQCSEAIRCFVCYDPDSCNNLNLINCEEGVGTCQHAVITQEDIEEQRKECGPPGSYSVHVGCHNQDKATICFCDQDGCNGKSVISGKTKEGTHLLSTARQLEEPSKGRASTGTNFDLPMVVANFFGLLAQVLLHFI